MASRIILVRHGQTIWSLSGKHTGRTDLPLTKVGEESAFQLRAPLEDVRFTQVLTSPLQRARQTCELAGLGGSAQVENDLREWDYGAYEGRTSAEIHAEQPNWSVFRDGCPQGESVEQIADRADRVLARLRALEGPVALFSHGHFLRALTARWIGLPVGMGEHLILDPVSIGVLGYEHSTTGLPAICLWNTGASLDLVDRT